MKYNENNFNYKVVQENKILKNKGKQSRRKRLCSIRYFLITILLMKNVITQKLSTIDIKQGIPSAYITTIIFVFVKLMNVNK